MVNKNVIVGIIFIALVSVVSVSALQPNAMNPIVDGKRVTFSMYNSVPVVQVGDRVTIDGLKMSNIVGTVVSNTGDKLTVELNSNPGMLSSRERFTITPLSWQNVSAPMQNTRMR